jgi:hypothetical protein
MARSVFRLTLTMLALTCLLTTPVQAQLLSPGKLAAPHQQLEGLRNCTSCHELGKRGVAAERCSSCHESVETRIAAGSGYHATVPANACATCHQDHLGVEFELVRFDTAGFAHDDVGYAPELSHATLDCRTCHEPGHVRDPAVVAEKAAHGALERTFLGLPTECAGCHREDDPHGGQFASRGCADCHDAGAWETPTGFDHSQARFRLDGEHARVECAQCHGSGADARYAQLPFRGCDDCHADPHGAAMEGTCASCHDTGGWSTLTTDIERSFDHSRTSFVLRGAHAAAACAACHRTGRAPSGELVHMAYQPGTAGRAYPLPVATSCSSCHVNRHVFPTATERWIRCADCHSEAVWEPSSFGAARHAQSTFALTGAHETTPCIACHVDTSRGHTRFTLAIPAERCESCHLDDDPHGGLYVGVECVTCHTTEAFEEVSFAHEPRPETCFGCHLPDDPHAGQFEGRDCASCHGIDVFTLASFDHSTTRYPLDGAHSDAPCAACHTASGSPAVVRYRPLGTECSDCHGENR